MYNLNIASDCQASVRETHVHDFVSPKAALHTISTFAICKINRPRHGSSMRSFEREDTESASATTSTSARRNRKAHRNKEYLRASPVRLMVRQNIHTYIYNIGARNKLYRFYRETTREQSEQAEIAYTDTNDWRRIKATIQRQSKTMRSLSRLAHFLGPKVDRRSWTLCSLPLTSVDNGDRGCRSLTRSSR